jgi:hypothetical protein
VGEEKKCLSGRRKEMPEWAEKVQALRIGLMLCHFCSKTIVLSELRSWCVHSDELRRHLEAS